MTASEKPETAAPSLSRAYLANPSIGDRLRQHMFSSVAVAALILVFATFAPRLFDRHQAAYREACLRENGWEVRGLGRIESLMTDAQLVWVESSDASVRRIVVDERANDSVPSLSFAWLLSMGDLCETDFVRDVPPGELMWVQKRGQALGGRCDCSMTYHIHESDAPRVFE